MLQTLCELQEDDITEEYKDERDVWVNGLLVMNNVFIFIVGYP